MPQTVHLIPYASTEQAQHAIMLWLASCPVLPSGVPLSFEDLPENDAGLCVTSNQGAFYSRRYITGGYEAAYDWRILYRVLPSDGEDALDAIGELNCISAWCEQAASLPVIPGATVRKIERTSDVAVTAVYDDGCRDYAAGFRMTWEVF